LGDLTIPNIVGDTIPNIVKETIPNIVRDTIPNIGDALIKLYETL
jgi:hypothetical protein